jgi:hypothetical protein
MKDYIYHKEQKRSIRVFQQIYNLIYTILDFELSPGYVCFMRSSGWFTGVCSLNSSSRWITQKKAYNNLYNIIFFRKIIHSSGPLNIATN